MDDSLFNEVEWFAKAMDQWREECDVLRGFVAGDREIASCLEDILHLREHVGNGIGSIRFMFETYNKSICSDCGISWMHDLSHVLTTNDMLGLPAMLYSSLAQLAMAVRGDRLNLIRVTVSDDDGSRRYHPFLDKVYFLSPVESNDMRLASKYMAKRWLKQFEGCYTKPRLVSCDYAPLRTLGDFGRLLGVLAKTDNYTDDGILKAPAVDRVFFRKRLQQRKSANRSNR